MTYLLAIVRDRLQDGAECLEAHSDVNEMCRKEEVVDVAQDGHGEVEEVVEEVFVGDDHAPLPDLILPLHVSQAKTQHDTNTSSVRKWFRLNTCRMR